MYPENPLKTNSTAPPAQQRLESVRPFAQKFQYQQLPLLLPIKPVETAAPLSETAEEVEEQAQEPT